MGARSNKSLFQFGFSVVAGLSIYFYSDYMELHKQLNEIKAENIELTMSLRDSISQIGSKDNEINEIKRRQDEFNSKVAEDEKNLLSTVPESYTYKGKKYNLRQLAQNASKEFNIPLPILVSLGHIESQWDCSLIGLHQDTGCFQVIPSTGEWAMRRLGIDGADLLDPSVNIRVGAWVLKTFTNEEKGDWAKGLANYNAGPGAWDRAPTVSRGYAARVLGRAIISPQNLK